MRQCLWVPCVRRDMVSCWVDNQHPRISAFIRMVDGYQKLWPQKPFPSSFHFCSYFFFSFYFSFPFIPMALNMNVSTAELSATDMTSMAMCVIKSKKLTKLCAGITLKADVVFRGDYFYCVFLLCVAVIHCSIILWSSLTHQPTNCCPALPLWPFLISKNRSSCYQLLACS